MERYEIECFSLQLGGGHCFFSCIFSSNLSNFYLPVTSRVQILAWTHEYSEAVISHAFIHHPLRFTVCALSSDLAMSWLRNSVLNLRGLKIAVIWAQVTTPKVTVPLSLMREYSGTVSHYDPYTQAQER